jgi:hypothetical protein
MQVSSMVRGNTPPAWHERTPASGDFYSLQCATERGATFAPCRERKRLREAYTTASPTKRTSAATGRAVIGALRRPEYPRPGRPYRARHAAR